jgi:hypothetical protein
MDTSEPLTDVPTSADPDSTYHPDADPDLTFHPDVDPDPDPSFRKRLKPLKKC